MSAHTSSARTDSIIHLICPGRLFSISEQVLDNDFYEFVEQYSAIRDATTSSLPLGSIIPRRDEK